MNRLASKTLLVSTAIALLLAGCMDPRKTPPARQRVDQEDLQKAGYMARFVLPYDNRQWFLRDLKQANFAASGSDYDTVTTTIGIPAPKIGMALDIVGLLGPSGRLQFVSALYLPEQVDGKPLDSAVAARQAGAEYLKEKIVEAAGRMGREVRCLHGCEGFAPSYALEKRGAALTTESAIYLTPIVGPMVEASADPLRDFIIGFTPKWMSKGENNARLCVGGTLRRTAEGQMALTEVEGIGTIASHYCNSRFVSLDEQRLLHTLSEDGYYFYGNTRTANILALNGRLYQVTGRRYNHFVTFEILPTQVAQR